MEIIDTDVTVKDAQIIAWKKVAVSKEKFN